jgi:hypothetical protein
VLLATVAYLGVFVLTLFAAYWAMFAQFRPWDDEGFFEYGIRLFLQGHPVYSGFYSDYGPFFYELWGALFKLAGRTISTDAGRTIQVGIWALASLALGFASHRLTRRLAIGISVQSLAFVSLWVMDNEPMHPGGLIVLLLAIAACVVAFGLDQRPRGTLFALGAIVACVGLIKVNQGGYALIALAFATVMAHPTLRARAWLRGLAAVVVVGAGPLLMYSELGQQWAQRYAIIAVGGTLALCIVATSVSLGAEENARTPLLSAGRFTAWWAGGVIVAGIVIVVAILALGSSLGAFISDTLIKPASTGSILATEPIALGSNVVIWALLAVAAAWGLQRSGALELADHVSGLVTGLPRVLIGIAIWFSVASIPPLSIAPDAVFALAMVLAWVAAVPPLNSPQSPRRYFVRLFITALALLEALDAYPVAGSQVWFGAALFLICGGICVADGWSDLETWWRERAGAVGSRLELSHLLTAGFAALAIGLVYDVEQEATANRDGYVANTPLIANGASQLRLGTQQDSAIEQIDALLLGHCRSLLTIPGRDSFNEWTGLPTPPDLIVEEHGPLTMSAADQSRALNTVRTTPGLCVLITSETGPIPQAGPPIEYIKHHYRALSIIAGGSVSGDYEYTVMVRKGSKSSRHSASSRRR